MPDHPVIIGLRHCIAFFHVPIVHGIAEDQIDRFDINRIIISVIPVYISIAQSQFRRGDHCSGHTQICGEVIQCLHLHQGIEKLLYRIHSQLIPRLPVHPHLIILLNELLVVDQVRVCLLLRVLKDIHKLCIDLEHSLRDRVKAGVSVRDPGIEHPVPVDVMVKIVDCF